MSRVPLTGSVTDVFAVTVIVVVNAPECVSDPPSVIVLVPLLTPVPPYVPPTREPCQVPVPIVPTVVSEDVTTLDARVVPVIPAAGAAVAVIVPDPVAAKLAPVPTTIAAVVFVAELIPENTTEPALPMTLVWSPVFVPDKLATAELANIELEILAAVGDGRSA